MDRFGGLSRRAFGVATIGLLAARPARADDATPEREAMMADASVLDGYVAALNAHDGEQAASFYTEDAVVRQAIKDGNTFTGREEIAGWVGDNVAGLPDLTVSVRSVTQQGDRLVWEWTYAGTYTGQFPGAPMGEGQAVQLEGVSVMELRDGEIARETLYYDNAAFLAEIDAEDVSTPAG